MIVSSLDAVTDGMKVRNAEAGPSSETEKVNDETVARTLIQNAVPQSAIRDQRIAGGAA